MLAKRTAINKTSLGGLALKGYDPVAYFNEGHAVQGRREYVHEWMGATWRFIRAANRDAFARDPRSTSRNMRGYCAWGSVKGSSSTAIPTCGRSSTASST